MNSAQFADITLKDKEIIDEYLRKYGALSYFHDFGTLYLWRDYYGIQIAETEGCLVVKTKDGYLFPLGEHPEKAMEVLSGEPAVFVHLDNNQKTSIDSAFPSRFSFENDRDSENYIYRTEMLATLPGPHYQEERRKNHRFERENADFSIETVSKDILPECRELYRKWREKRLSDMESAADSSSVSSDSGPLSGNLPSASSENLSFEADSKAMEECFELYEELGFIGVALRIGGKIKAFDIAEKMPVGNCLDLHFEKADGDVRDIYPALRKAFAGYVFSEYPEIEYINFEDDMGVPGLRNWKTQYRPDQMWPSITAKLKP